MPPPLASSVASLRMLTSLCLEDNSSFAVVSLRCRSFIVRRCCTLSTIPPGCLTACLPPKLSSAARSYNGSTARQPVQSAFACVTLVAEKEVFISEHFRVCDRSNRLPQFLSPCHSLSLISISISLSLEAFDGKRHRTDGICHRVSCRAYLCLSVAFRQQSCRRRRGSNVEKICQIRLSDQPTSQPTDGHRSFGPPMRTVFTCPEQQRQRVSIGSRARACAGTRQSGNRTAQRRGSANDALRKCSWQPPGSFLKVSRRRKQ